MEALNFLVLQQTPQPKIEIPISLKNEVSKNFNELNSLKHLFSRTFSISQSLKKSITQPWAQKQGTYAYMEHKLYYDIPLGQQ